MDWFLSEVLMPERLEVVYEAPNSPRGWKAPKKGELHPLAVTDCI